MLKMIGLLLVTAAGAGAGIGASIALRRRAAALEDAACLLRWLATRIRYSAASVGELLWEASQEREFSSLLFLQPAARGIREGQDPVTAWSQALEKLGKAGGLSRSDRELLDRFGAGLGKTDIEGQLSHCELYGDLLAEHLGQARDEVRAKGRLYTTLGVIGGAAFALLML
ncbi:MAG: hypothetical protein HFJ80_05945 [Clostridiales bacterium]|nr:hypothetical protein [Clostridiales bacterium]